MTLALACTGVLAARSHHDVEVGAGPQAASPARASSASPAPSAVTGARFWAPAHSRDGSRQARPWVDGQVAALGGTPSPTSPPPTRP